MVWEELVCIQQAQHKDTVVRVILPSLTHLLSTCGTFNSSPDSIKCSDSGVHQQTGSSTGSSRSAAASAAVHDLATVQVIMWELWTGQEPFEGIHLHALLHQLAQPEGLSLPIPGSPDWRSEEPPPPEPASGWCDLMQRCWCRVPQQRPTARQLVSTLADMLRQVRASKRSQTVGHPQGSAGGQDSKE